MTWSRRPTESLDGSWTFVPDPDRRLAPDRLPAGSPIRVPGPWEASWPEPYGLIRGWYRRTFRVPDDWSGGSIVLRFGSAMATARIWVDGRPAGQHDDGYLPFEVDAGAAIAGSTHELIASVENPVNALTEFPGFGPEAVGAAADRLGGASFDAIPHGKQSWYTSTSGLLGPVAAEWAPERRFRAIEVEPDARTGTVMVRWRLTGATAGSDDRVRLRVTAPGGQVVGDVVAAAGIGQAAMVIPEVVPWDLWRPALYRLDAILEADGRPAGGGPPDDRGALAFGMRSIDVRDGSIVLNGRPIYPRGALDQDFWPDGMSSAPSRAALEAQVALARELGLNLLRCHIKVPDPTYLEVADQVGILVWCELPSWRSFTGETGAAARRLLEGMLETMGHHPSIVAWTVVNEEWGIDLARERDRRWLRTTVDWLKRADPGRLVVDNSACETGGEPGFHLRTDLADFHAYRSMPDGLPRWQALLDDLADRPRWLWSPHGDASATGHEAIVISEFGNWGLPRPPAGGRTVRKAPWWWTTGGAAGPIGIEERFLEQGLDRIWPDLGALAEATQWRQYDALAAQIRELRRRPAIRGYVVTELTDVAWEANGLLDFSRRPKAFHERFAVLNAPEILILDPPPRDLWGGERIRFTVTLASAPDVARDPVETGATAGTDDGGRLEWSLQLDDGPSVDGSTAIDAWPAGTVREIATIDVPVPDVSEVTSGELRVSAQSGGSRSVASFLQDVVVCPAARRRAAAPRRVRVVDPLDQWSIASRLQALGHEVADAGPADVVVAARLDAALLRDIERGATLLLLARSADAIDESLPLAVPIAVRSRRPGGDTMAEDRSWEGDWISVFAWAMPGVVAGLPGGGLLGDACAEIYPSHVLAGFDPADAGVRVDAGIFAGWLRSPAALLATLRQGAGTILATTLGAVPGDGPVATALLESLVERALPAAAGTGDSRRS